MAQKKSNNYIKALQKDKKKTSHYYLKSLQTKTEQQKFLEKLLKKTTFSGTIKRIGDIACGAGSLSFHLSNLPQFKACTFDLVDFNNDAIELAKNNIPNPNFKFWTDSIYNLKHHKKNSFDVVFCWQTLSWLDNPESALEELIRITKPKGKIFLSSLFNTEFDVDIYSKVLDHTHASARSGILFNYNTYSAHTVKTWLKGKAKKHTFHKFSPLIDFNYDKRGLGTFTKTVVSKERLQISGGLLLNWAVLEITK